MSISFGRLLKSAVALAVAALFVVGMAFDTQAQRRDRGRHDRTERHDRGRHLGWERGRRVGHQRRAWENRNRRRGWETRNRRNVSRRDRREVRRDRREVRRDRREWRRDRRDRRDRRINYYGSPRRNVRFRS